MEIKYNGFSLIAGKEKNEDKELVNDIVNLIRELEITLKYEGNIWLTDFDNHEIVAIKKAAEIIEREEMLEEAKTKLFRAKIAFEDAQFECQEVIKNIIGEEVNVYVEIDTIRFEILTLLDNEVREIAQEIEKKTKSKYNDACGFEFNE